MSKDKGIFILNDQFHFKDLQGRKDVVLLLEILGQDVPFGPKHSQPNIGGVAGGARGSVTQDGVETVVAWAEVPILQDGAMVMLNAGLHRLVVFRPPVDPVRPPRHRTPIAGARLLAAIVEPSAATASSSRADQSVPQAVLWIECKQPVSMSVPFNKADGFDLYIDAARYLPSNVTISKVVGRIFNADYEKQGPDLSTGLVLDSDIFSPAYGFRLEYRDLAMSPTSTLLVKIYTIELHTKELCVVGYAALNLFLEANTVDQPQSEFVSSFMLNEGAHQIRIHKFRPDTSKPLSVATMQEQPFIPCASLLVRVLRPPRDPRGHPLSSASVPKHEWQALELDVPAQPYSAGGYYSNTCCPAPEEHLIFKTLVQRKITRVRDSLPLIGDGGERRLLDDKAMRHWIRTRLTRTAGLPPADMDLTYLCQYSPVFGFKIAIDAAFNLPKSRIPFALVSLFPPGSLYTDVGADSTLKTFESLDWDNDACTARSPIWVDRYELFTQHPMDRRLVAVVDCRTLDDKGKLVPQGWAVASIFTADGYVAMNRLRLPLFHGTPPLDFLEDLAQSDAAAALGSALARKRIKAIPGASIIVRIADARRAVELPPTARIVDSVFPALDDKSYQSVVKSKPARSLLVKGTTVSQHEEAVVKASQALVAPRGLNRASSSSIALQDQLDHTQLAAG